jgi:hypothetical protein
VAWGHKKRLGAQQGSQSEQFKKAKAKKGRPKKAIPGGIGLDGRCQTCGGTDGRHGTVRVSRAVMNPDRTRSGQYKIVNERCPHG